MKTQNDLINYVKEHRSHFDYAFGFYYNEQDYTIVYRGVGFIIVKKAGKGNNKEIKISY